MIRKIITYGGENMIIGIENLKEKQKDKEDSKN